MQVLLLSARVILAITLGLAGVSKLVDTAAFRTAVREFGVPLWLAGPISRGLPPIEIAIAFLLLYNPTAQWGAVGATALLLMFTAAIGTNLARGRTPSCRCFGQLRSVPIGWRTLARNGVLGALSAFVVVSRPGTGWADAAQSLAGFGVQTTTAKIAVAIGVLVTAALMWMLVRALRKNGRLLLRIDALEARLDGFAPKQPESPHGLPIGAPAPAFDLQTLTGGRVSLSALQGDGRPSLLIFSDPDCGSCTALLPEIAHWQRGHRDVLRLLLITPESKRGIGRVVDGKDIGDFLIQVGGAVAVAYRVNGTPAAVLIGADGRIASHLVMGSEAIAELVGYVTADAGRVPEPTLLPRRTDHPLKGLVGLPIGETAPVFSLPDSSGAELTLQGVQGNTTALLFWNPPCAFCQRMLPKLVAWEKDTPRGAPKLVVVSAGARTVNEPADLRSTVLFDATSSLSREFRVKGTPSAVLVDGDGRIASELAVGESNVFALLGGRTTMVA